MPSLTVSEDSFTSVATGKYPSYHYAITQAPAHGTLVALPSPPTPTGSGGAYFRYTPAADYNGPDTFTIQDSNGTSIFSVAVTPEPDAPVANDDVLASAGYRVAATELLKNDFDVDGETLALTAVGAAVNGSVALSNGFVTFTPTDPSYRGDAVFSYTASDPTGRTDTAMVTLKGAAPTTPPVLNLAGRGSANEGSGGPTAFTFTVTRSGDLSSASEANFFVWHEATSPSDFAGNTSGAIRFDAGAASQQITVYVNADTAVEPDEAFHVQLYDAKGATVGIGDVKAVILNDDGPAQPPPPPPPSGGGEVFTSPAPGSTVTGGAGSDTINASQGPDVLSGGAGGDTFAYGALPWNAGRITDFAVGVDRLDLSAIFRASGYAGSDPIADGRMRLDADGAGGTRVYFDRDATDSGEWPFLVTTLDHVSPSGLTWARLSAGGSAPPASPGGQVVNSPGPGSTVVGTAGNDTLNASQGPDQLTGGGGGDHFAWAQLPWNAGHLTDFTPGVDKLDLRALFMAGGYTGSDPIAEGRLEFRADGAGNTQVYFDHDASASGDWPFLITTLDGIRPSQIGAGDWLFH